MKRIPPPRLLSFFGLAALTCLSVILLGRGVVPVWALVLLGFFHSIFFPTIFALSIKHLGLHTKLGSSLLVMSIICGAVFPAMMGYIPAVVIEGAVQRLRPKTNDRLRCPRQPRSHLVGDRRGQM